MSAASTDGSAAEAPTASNRRGGATAWWRRRPPVTIEFRWSFAAIWLFFLAYPVVALWNSDQSAARTTYGLVVIAVFAVIYVAACVQVIPMRADPPDPAVALRYFLILVVIAIASTPVLANGSLAFGPYLIAMAIFGFSQRVGLTVTALIVALSLVGPEVFPGWDLDVGTVVALVVSGGAMLAARTMQLRERERAASDARQRLLDEQLAVVAERERVARDVHDILGHSLTVMTVKSELAGRLVDIDPERAKAELAELHSMSRRALAEVRATVGGLRTPDLRTELASARSALTAAEIGADLPDDLPDIPPSRGALFAWVLRESVTNVVRHSGAARCVVAVDDEHIEVRDDGCGISSHDFGNGLRGLTERVEAAGGRLSVQATGDGTAVRVTVG